MTSQSPRRQALRPVPGTAELAELHTWLVRARRDRPFSQMSEAAYAAGHGVTERTLRRAVDGRVPTLRVVRAWAAGTGADPAPGEELLARVRIAREPRARERSDASRITTRTGLVRAMKRVRARAGQPTERELAARGGPRLPRSTLGAVLREESPVTAELLQAFLSACGVPDAEADPLLEARGRIGRPQCNGAEAYPCAVAERAYEQREYERSRNRYRGIAEPDEDGSDGDRYDGMPHPERFDPDLVSDEELEALEAEAAAAVAQMGEQLEEERARLREGLLHYLRDPPRPGQGSPSEGVQVPPEQLRRPERMFGARERPAVVNETQITEEGRNSPVEVKKRRANRPPGGSPGWSRPNSKKTGKGDGGCTR